MFSRSKSLLLRAQSSLAVRRTFSTSTSASAVELKRKNLFVENGSESKIAEILADERNVNKFFIHPAASDNNVSKTTDKNVLLRSSYASFLRTLSPKQNVTYVEGARGVGKSTLLSLAVRQAREEGWITLYVPSPREFLVEEHALEHGTGTAQPLVRSRIRPDYFNQPLGAQLLLKQLDDHHAEALSTLPQKKSYEHNLYKKGDEQTLHVIVQRGLRELANASDALYDLRMELGLVEEKKVMIAVDEFNCLYWPSAFYARNEHVPPGKMLLTESLRCVDEAGNFREEYSLTNGVNLVATTKKYAAPYGGWKEIVDKRDFYPNRELYQPFDIYNNYIGTQRENMFELGNYSKNEFKKIIQLERLGAEISGNEPVEEKSPEVLEYEAFMAEQEDKKTRLRKSVLKDMKMFERLTERNPYKVAKKASSYL